MSIDVINPATGEIRQSYALESATDIKATMDKMHAIQQEWAKTPFSQRAECLLKAAELLRERQMEYATIITEEMGKPITQAKTEIEKCAWICEYYAEEGENHLKPTSVKTEKAKSYVCYEPLGIVFAVMPWNYPFWQVMRFAAPNLMGGNAGLLKHAPNSMGAGKAMQQLFMDAGFPEGLFYSLVCDVDAVPAIIEHHAVAGVTLTGSEGAGAAVASLAGQALKKVVLELGGTDPYLILQDADIDLAAEQCVISRLNNTGQVCIAAKRIIVVEPVYDALVEAITEKAKGYQSGDPMLEGTKLGPMARDDLRQGLHKQVQQAIADGAKCVMGGEMPDGDGCFYPATILLDVKSDNTAFREELFGPVIIVIEAKDEEEAIRMANDSNYGLAAGVFTTDVARGEEIARDHIRAGTVSVNGYVSSDPRLPFGGIKRSGYGREMAAAGIHEFMNMKTVLVN
jgi:succinate-semialdehyde dehydrogenase / glutarate-semialdehyde dehydrogenase